MNDRYRALTYLFGAAFTFATGSAFAASAAPAHNVILFVPDGLRAGIVAPDIAPALSNLRAEGVDFSNSHSIFPTFTMPNASALATGHYLGDTGVFANTLYMDFKVRISPQNSTVTPFIEYDPALKDINNGPGFPGGFIAPETLLTAARRAGFSTAAIGKLGPAGLQNLAALNGDGSILVDDSTGSAAPDGMLEGALLPPEIENDIARLIGPRVATPARGENGKTGTCTSPGTRVSNEVQQQWFADVATKVVLPRFAAAGKPFFMVYWSRDPDGSQHNNGDSLGELVPGINGQTSKKAVRTADDNLRQLRETLRALGLEGSTDIIVSADHGFSTISKESKTSPAATQECGDLRHILPPGFLALDLATALDLPAADPDTGYSAITSAPGSLSSRGNAVIGKDISHPEAVVVAAGGSDLVYLPNANKVPLAQRIVAFLLTQDYVSGIFFDDALGDIPGTLPMSAIAYKGGAKTRQPSILVNFRSFVAPNCRLGDVLCAATVSDTTLLQGQGMHGSFSRADTANFMAAVGPSFKAGYKDSMPTSNADVGATIAQLLGLKIDKGGKLTGRVMKEALKSGEAAPFKAETLRSTKAANGLETILNYQTVGATRYFDAAGFPGRTVGLISGTP